MTTERTLDQEEQAAGVASLTKRLRAIAGPETPLRSYVADLMREAADALEAVERERDEWRQECGRARVSLHFHAKVLRRIRHVTRDWRCASERNLRRMAQSAHDLTASPTQHLRTYLAVLGEDVGFRLAPIPREALAARTPEGGTDGE